jgi:hypothetical protein
MDNIFDILSTYVYKANTISPQIWFFYPCIIYSIIGLEQNVDTSSVPLINEHQE